MSISTLTPLHPGGTEYRDLAGTRVPWQFGDYAAEYHAIRNSTALLDHSAIGLTKLTGDVTKLLQRVLARDAEFLTPERCMMTLILADDGSVIDLVTVYSFDDYVLLESSHGRHHDMRKHLAAHAGDDVEITALDGEWAMLGVEGPYSWGAVGRVLDPAITALPYESVLEIDRDGTSLIFSRSGFSGEYGYKLIAPSPMISQLWDALRIEATPVGQRALETAMLEVRQPVLHREMVDDVNVVTSGIQWLVDPTKSDFIGRAPVMEQLADATAPRLLGLGWTGDDELPGGTEVLAGDTVIGHLKVSVYSPGLAKWLGLAMIDGRLAAPDLTFDLRAGERRFEATSLSSPYVIPTSWTIPIL
ncbi:MAG TPA: glycine cleavage T C-terminal barrel domain-containing protein [Streptosporangiaceae bacterium]